MRIRGLNVSASTAFHSQELGFRTILIEDASRGIKVMKSNSDHVFLEVEAKVKQRTIDHVFFVFTPRTQEPDIEAAFAKIREEQGCVVKSKEATITITNINASLDKNSFANIIRNLSKQGEGDGSGKRQET